MNEAREAFEKWAHANTSKIHVDALNEAAMGFAAGWAARQLYLATIESILRMRYDWEDMPHLDFDKKYPWFVGLSLNEEEDMLDVCTAVALGEEV